LCGTFFIVVADDVEVNYFGCGSWYPATISAILSEPLRYVISYEDESVVEEADPNNIRKLIGTVYDDTATRTEEAAAAAAAEAPASASASASASGFESPTAGRDEVNSGTPYFVNSDETAYILPRHEILGTLGTLLMAREKETPTADAEARSAVFSEISTMLTEASELAMEDGKTKIAMKYLEDANIASSRGGLQD
jgi:hypothetical protein